MTSPEGMGEKPAYVFNRLLKMSTELKFSSWKRGQVQNFLKHPQIDEILRMTDMYGRSLVDVACSYGNIRLSLLLWNHGARCARIEETLVNACSNEESQLSTLEFLLGVKPEAAKTLVQETSGGKEKTPLLNFCVRNGNARAVKIIINSPKLKNTDYVVKSLDAAGNTPLHLVSTTTIASILLSNNVKVASRLLRMKNCRGMTPIESVMERRNMLQRQMKELNPLVLQMQMETLNETLLFLADQMHRFHSLEERVKPAQPTSSLLDNAFRRTTSPSPTTFKPIPDLSSRYNKSNGLWTELGSSSTSLMSSSSSDHESYLKQIREEENLIQSMQETVAIRRQLLSRLHNIAQEQDAINNRIASMPSAPVRGRQTLPQLSQRRVSLTAASRQQFDLRAAMDAAFSETFEKENSLTPEEMLAAARGQHSSLITE